MRTRTARKYSREIFGRRQRWRHRHHQGWCCSARGVWERWPHSPRNGAEAVPISRVSGTASPPNPRPSTPPSLDDTAALDRSRPPPWLCASGAPASTNARRRPRAERDHHEHGRPELSGHAGTASTHPSVGHVTIDQTPQRTLGSSAPAPTVTSRLPLPRSPPSSSPWRGPSRQQEPSPGPPDARAPWRRAQAQWSWAWAPVLRAGTRKGA